ncbi:MAG TPA: heat-inducible transcriptional repressor HrcA [Actinomycetota bacterium]|nr:heat-inducible transcriptional repressor HrcA [Actinomycetota bacterium]
MADRSELGARKAAVLRAVVEEYVRTGEPVGSETIAERSGLGVSSATIRNEMAALEEMGYLAHPHTSAGRVPTDLGYRYYVDQLPAALKLREAQRRAIAGFFAQTMLDLEDVLRGTTRLLSRLTQYAGLAVPPSIAEEPVLRLELIDMGSALMVLAVGQHGRVDKRVFDRPEGLSERALRDAEQRLQTVHGRPLGEARAAVLRMAAEGAAEERAVLLAAADALGDMQRTPAEPHLLVGGVANLAEDVAHWRSETVRRLFEALERESTLLGLLRDAGTAGDVSVTIGTEHPATGEWHAALVAAPFHAGSTALGTIGVVGPTRMDYLTAMAAVRAVARRLSELATELGA